MIADHPEMPSELALQGFDGRARLHARSRAEPPVPRGDARVRPIRRGGLGGSRRAARRPLPLRPHGRARRSRRGHRPPRRLGLVDGRARGVAASASPRAAPTPRRSSTATTSSRSTSASRAACCSRSRPIGPGFTADEPLETLGERLSLPPNYEHLRERLERRADAAAGRRGRSAPASDDRAPRAAGRRRAGGAARPLPRARRRRARPLSRCSTCSTRSVACSASRRAGRSRCRPAVPTGTRCRRSATPTRRRSCRPTRRVSAWLDGLWETTGIAAERTVLGGFSQGAVMTYSLGLGRGRPRPAALDRAERVHADRPGLRARPRAAAAARRDRPRHLRPVISVEWGRRARQQLEDAGADVLYREYPLPHAVDPGFLVELAPWLSAALAAPAPPAG